MSATHPAWLMIFQYHTILSRSHHVDLLRPILTWEQMLSTKMRFPRSHWNASHSCVWRWYSIDWAFAWLCDLLIVTWRLLKSVLPQCVGYLCGRKIDHSQCPKPICAFFRPMVVRGATREKSEAAWGNLPLFQSATVLKYKQVWFSWETNELFGSTPKLAGNTVWSPILGEYNRPLHHHQCVPSSSSVECFLSRPPELIAAEVCFFHHSWTEAMTRGVKCFQFSGNSGSKKNAKRQADMVQQEWIERSRNTLLPYRAQFWTGTYRPHQSSAWNTSSILAGFWTRASDDGDWWLLQAIAKPGRLRASSGSKWSRCSWAFTRTSSSGRCNTAW